MAPRPSSGQERSTGAANRGLPDTGGVCAAERRARGRHSFQLLYCSQCCHYLYIYWSQQNKPYGCARTLRSCYPVYPRIILTSCKMLQHT